MNTLTYIILYIVICAVIALLVPSARNKWRNHYRWYYPVEPKDSSNYLPPRWQRLSKAYIIFIAFTLLLFILTPILTLDLMIKDKKRKKKRNEYTENTDTNLYFRYMSGSGFMNCCDCGYSESITSSWHSFDDFGAPSDGVAGYQCQSCGKFYSLGYKDDRQCDCGGELEDEKPVFCPKCKSKNVKYVCRCIT